MILILIWGAAVACLFLYLRSRPTRRAIFTSALRVGLVTGFVRWAAASLGMYVLGRTGGPLQLPAYLLALSAWPDSYLLAGSVRTVAGLELFLRLLVLLVPSTLMLAFGVAFLASLWPIARNPDSGPGIQT